MAGPYAGLLPYARARQTTSADILPLSAGTVIGTAIGGDPNKVYGVSAPLPDQYVLIPSETAAIESARAAFNNTVKSVADANTTRIAFADVDQHMEALIAARIMVINNVAISPNINPPSGIYSEDGIHPNSRGYAYIANAIITALNTRFGSTVNAVDISKYQATALPIP
jgi:lysophospholipase L1-like esterase